MSVFETQYTDMQGNSLENLLAKIMSRYLKEGKPQASPQVKQEEVSIINQSQGYFSSAKKSSVSMNGSVAKPSGVK